MNKGLSHFYADLIKQGKNRYPYELYAFIFDTIYQTSLAEQSVSRKGNEFHLSPKKICSLFSMRMRNEFGPFSEMVLDAWGVKSSLDIGKAVMAMAGDNYLKLAGNETLEDFKQAGLNT